MCLLAAASMVPNMEPVTGGNHDTNEYRIRSSAVAGERGPRPRVSLSGVERPRQEAALDGPGHQRRGGGHDATQRDPEALASVVDGREARGRPLHREVDSRDWHPGALLRPR